MRMHLGFLSIILFSSVMWGECRPSRMDSCARMNLIHAEYGILESILFFKPMCRVEFEEVDSKAKWKALVKDCPDVKGANYVYIMYSCAEPPFSFLVHDELEVWSEGACETRHADRSNERKIFAEIDVIFKKDASVEDILKAGFFIREKHGLKWIFHLRPGYRVDAEVYNESCVKGDECEDGTYRILNLIKVRREFIRD